ncbi:hypothetical protein Daus18300_011559 [Diaporthe australafricana]|uniref:C2H2-type domain-containing protein n=1 Tax=Diaporthe australafricana TaxID=127596 RepID=A0ABR3W692_9PEZI
MTYSKPSSPESQCPKDYPPSLIQGSFFGQEHTSLAHHYTGDKPIKKDGEVSILPKPAGHCRKRSVEKAFSSDEVDLEGARARQKAKTDADSSAKTRRQLACPFQKLDSHKHHECLKYALHRIKDVKQHIYRRHKQPDYYCARCFEVFKTGQARDDHARTARCNNKDTPGFEGISDEQRTQLNKGSCRALDVQGKWFEIWDIIFPGQAPPSSPWVGSYMEEMAPLLRSLWKNKSSEILAKALTKDQARTLDQGVLDGVVRSIFDCLELETSTSLGKHANGTCSQEQLKLSESQSPTSAPHSTFMNDSIYPFMLGQPHGDFELEEFQTQDVFRTI